MNRLTYPLLIALTAGVLTLAGCARDKDTATSDAAASAAAADSGGSAAGDFGPPQGEPIKADPDRPAARAAGDRSHRAGQGDRRTWKCREVEMEISEGVNYTFWTFGGTVPGSFIRVRQGDTVEFHLQQPSRQQDAAQHRPARASPARAAARRRASPRRATARSSPSRRSTPGLYVYHCATAPVGMHVANGMYGLILVEPPEGLPKVDREYYVMQGDFYTVGKYREKGLQPFDMEKAIDENPTYVAVQRLGRRAGRRQGAHRPRSARPCASSSATAARTSSRAST